MAVLTGLHIFVSTISWVYWAVVGLITFMVGRKWGRSVSVAVLAVLATPLVILDYRQIEGRIRHANAVALYQAHCKNAGEKIHQRVEGVEGIFLMKLRSGSTNDSDQFKLDDPYGRDYDGEGYILGFLHGFHMGLDGYDPDGKRIREAKSRALLYPPGYAYVEAVDPKDGMLYRYTGVRRVRHQMSREGAKHDLMRNPDADLNVYVFALERTPIQTRTARYGVTYDDISTIQDREHWIAGSSLRVVDLEKNEVVAERVGFMMDWAQGSRARGRSPWLYAADKACPVFANPLDKSQPEFTAQPGQTLRLVSRALISTQGK